MISRDAHYVVNFNLELMIEKIESLIDFSHKVDFRKGNYSSRKALYLVQELNSINAISPNKREIIKDPDEKKSLRLDSLMSVFNVEQRKPIRRGRSKTRINGNINPRIFSLNHFNSTIQNENNKRKYSNFNKIQALKEKQAKSEHLSQQEELQCQMRQEKNQEASKNNQEVEDRTKKHRIFLNALNRKKMIKNYAQDYTGEQIKLKRQPKDRLVTQQKSLEFEIVKKAEKVKVEKRKKKVNPIQVETIKVTERKKKKKEEKRKRKRTLLQEEIVTPPEPIIVEFSNIKSLAENFRCQDGIVFSTGSEMIRNSQQRRYQTVSPKSIDHRLSKQEFTMLKRRSLERSLMSANSVEKSQSTLVQSITNKKQKQLKDKVNNSLTHRYRNTEKIHVNEMLLYEDLLEPTFDKKSSVTKTEESQLQDRRQTKIPLNANDRFNQKYIIGNQKKRSQNQLRIVTGGFLLPKVKDLHMKNREKIERREAMQQLSRRRFEQSLRNE